MSKPRKEPTGRPKEVFQQDLPGMPFFRDSPAGASGMLLRTASDVFSRWYAAMCGAYVREQERKKEYRREHGFKAGQKVLSMQLSPSDSESSIADASESVIRAMFGDTVADYAKGCFLRAMRTGDKRAFKIRLLMLKARDSLKGLLREEFSKYAPIYISDAENQAGCKQAPHSPRRMSNAEKAIKQRREEAKRILESSPDLFSCVASEQMQQECHNEERPSIPDTHREEEPQPPQNQGLGKTSPTPPASVAQSTEHGIIDQTPVEHTGVHPLFDNDKCGKTDPDKAISKNSASISCIDGSQYVGESYGKCSVGRKRPSKPPRKQPTIQPTEIPSKPQAFVRKAREHYNSQSEIVEDIEAGKITMYDTPAEIVADMHADKLSPSEAMMFLSVWGQHTGGKRKRRGGGRKRKAEFESLAEKEELDNEEENYGEGYEDQEQGEGRRGSEADWSPEDDW